MQNIHPFSEAVTLSATETKYSLVKHSIAKADIEEHTQAEVHDNSEDTEESDAENDKSSKSVKFNEQNTLVADVGNEDTEGPLELEEGVAQVSARAVSTPASESSPRPSAAEDASVLDRPISAKSEGTSSVAENTLGK